MYVEWHLKPTPQWNCLPAAEQTTVRCKHGGEAFDMGRPSPDAVQEARVH